MRAAFVDGKDLHTVFARMLVGEQYDQLPDEEQALWRKRAKAGNFGNLFGTGRARLPQLCMGSSSSLALTLDEADAIRDAFYATYPAIRPYQLAQYREGRARRGVVGRRPPAPGDLGTGRRALVPGVRQLRHPGVRRRRAARSHGPGRPGAARHAGRIVHDELVLLVAEDQAEHAAAVLAEQMTAAFVRWFPGAPTRGLVSVKTVSSWARCQMTADRPFFQIVLRADSHRIAPLVRLRQLLKRALGGHAFRTVRYVEVPSTAGKEHAVKTSEVLTGQLFKAADIEGPVAHTITNVTVEAVGRDREQKLVLAPAGTKQRLVVNLTNRHRLVAALGDDTDGWLGRKIELSVEQVPFGREIVDWIVVRIPPQKPGKRAPAPGPLDDLDDDQAS